MVLRFPAGFFRDVRFAAYWNRRGNATGALSRPGRHQCVRVLLLSVAPPTCNPTRCGKTSATLPLCHAPITTVCRSVSCVIVQVKYMVLKIDVGSFDLTCSACLQICDSHAAHSPH